MTEKNLNKEIENAERKFYKGVRGAFNNNKFVFFFSLFIAFCLWLWVSVEKSPVVDYVITGVPVQIESENSIPSQLGLKVFGSDKYTVDVTVSGKKFIVSSLSADDIKVVAQTNYVDSAGSKSLVLKAVAESSKDFEITALSQSYITVYFDTYKEAEFAIEPNILSEGQPLVTDGCILGNVVFSKSTVTVSGPSTEVNKIKGVVATTTVSEPLTATKTVTPEIDILGASDTSNLSVDIGESELTMTLPVLKETTLPTTITFKNAPAGYVSGSVSKSVYPSTVKVAVPIEKIDEIKEISVGTVDFSDLDSGNNVFSFKTADITDYHITDSVKSFKVNVNMSGMATTFISIPASNIVITHQKDGYSSSVKTAAIQNVKIIGPADSINSLTASSVFAEIDLSQADVTEGTLTVPVTITVRSNNLCWANGNYSAAVTAIIA